MEELEKFCLCPQKEVYDSIIVDESTIRKDKVGCYIEAIWDQIIDKNGDNFRIAEMGSWFGDGIVKTADKFKSLGKKFKIVCVDTWLGSPEHLVHDSIVNGEFNLKNGYPQYYYKFLEAVKYYGHENEIIPFPNTTLSFLHMARMHKCKFDFIIVDGSHQYEDVIQDLNIAWELLDRGGIIYGDDLLWPTVGQALGRFCLINNIKPILVPGQTPTHFLIQKL